MHQWLNNEPTASRFSGFIPADPLKCILSHMDALTLLVSVPRVCKMWRNLLLNNLTHFASIQEKFVNDFVQVGYGHKQLCRKIEWRSVFPTKIRYIEYLGNIICGSNISNLRKHYLQYCFRTCIGRKVSRGGCQRPNKAFSEPGAQLGAVRRQILWACVKSPVTDCHCFDLWNSRMTNMERWCKQSLNNHWFRRSRERSLNVQYPFTAPSMKKLSIKCWAQRRLMLSAWMCS